MDPLKPADDRPNRVIPEERSIKYTEWETCENTYRYCAPCGSHLAVMQKRIVTGRDGDTCKEYRIWCTNCGQKSGVHMSRNLTIFDWDGHQEEKDTLKMFRRKRK